MNMGEASQLQSHCLVGAVKARNLAAAVLGKFMPVCCPNRELPKWTQKKAQAINGYRTARLLFEVHGHEIFQNGLFNSDPHAGNVLVLSDGRLGLIDYGGVARLTTEQRTC